MPFDPTKTDAERVYEAVEEEFEDAWVSIFKPRGQPTVKVEPPEGSDARDRAEDIEAFLSEKGLRTQVNALNDDGTIYEVTATTDAWA